MRTVHIWKESVMYCTAVVDLNLQEERDGSMEAEQEQKGGLDF